MKDIGNVIDEIDIKIRKLVSEKASLKSELDEKDRMIEELQSQIIQLIEENKDLKGKIQIDNLTNIINNNSDISYSTEIIDELLRKVNKSISILTKHNDRR